MEINENNYCVILAGGKGKRLWPCSRDEKPKQFIDFFGVGRTQLQQTFDRLTKMLPKRNVFICTNREYAPMVREQLPDVHEENLMIEPVNRGTAPSVAWANMRICRRNPQANVIITPSDQLVLNEEAFYQNIDEAFYFVSHRDNILTLGVQPSRPEPGYGYIQKGDYIMPERAPVAKICTVKSFVEKPERDFAQMFMDSGEFLWNTGIILSNAHFLNQCFRQLFPEVLTRFDNTHSDITIEEEMAFVNENYPAYPNLSIDQGVLEHGEHVCVMNCDFGWADLGTWHALYEYLSRGEGDNVVVDSEVMLEDSHNNVIKLPKGRLGVINGLDGYIVAESDNVLLICKKGDSSALVRKYVNEVRMKYGDEYV
ncbi:MAG: mannose-1-phosphate guanylyltransferase [Prevotella sp.]|nr:mannose-1-phosphate guanylyltransferase [Prevotella sp.]MBR1545785.1 mannose-1-phosphate guanylyltransferase [Prevotella sp.]